MSVGAPARLYGVYTLCCTYVVVAFERVVFTLRGLWSLGAAPVRPTTAGRYGSHVRGSMPVRRSGSTSRARTRALHRPPGPVGSPRRTAPPECRPRRRNRGRFSKPAPDVLLATPCEAISNCASSPMISVTPGSGGNRAGGCAPEAHLAWPRSAGSMFHVEHLRLAATVNECPGRHTATARALCAAAPRVAPSATAPRPSVCRPPHRLGL